MTEVRRAVIVWASAVCVAAAAFAGFLQHVRWLSVIATAIGGLAFLILLISGIPDLVGWIAQRRHESGGQRESPSPAFTARWRHTTDGIDAAGLMITLQKALFHPGFPGGTLGNEPPTVRIGVLVACDPLRDKLSTSTLTEAFLRFLDQPPLRDLVRQVTHVPDDSAWRAYGSNGRVTNGAVLVGDDDVTAPIASALMNLNESPTQRFGQDPRCAELLLLLAPENENGKQPPPTCLEEWHRRIVTALGVPEAFVAFLTEVVGVRTHADPPAQLGLRVDARPSVAALIDVSGFARIAGASAAASFPSYLVADPSGRLPAEVALDVLRVWCDHALHVSGYEDELDAVAVRSRSRT